MSCIVLTPLYKPRMGVFMKILNGKAVVAFLVFGIFCLGAPLDSYARRCTRTVTADNTGRRDIEVKSFSKNKITHIWSQKDFEVVYAGDEDEEWTFKTYVKCSRQVKFKFKLKRGSREQEYKYNGGRWTTDTDLDIGDLDRFF